MDVEGVSVLTREILKADYILAQDEKAALEDFKRTPGFLRFMKES